MTLRDVFKPLDQRSFDVWHIKSLITTGMGVFTDGYDLSSIGLVLTTVLSYFGVTAGSPEYKLWSSLLAGSALAGAAIGALIFGYLANKGRKKFYGIDVTLMTIGALLQAVVTSPLQLVLVRGLLGVGVGADYVLSPMIMAEHSNAKDRGKLIAFGFGMMWGFGYVVASTLDLVLTSLGVSLSIIWRVVLAAGAIPAVAVVYLRRKIPETPRYLLRIQGDSKAFKEVVKTLAKTDVNVKDEYKDIRTFKDYFARFYKVFITAAVLWFLFDIVAYSGILFGPSKIAPAVGIKNGAVFNLLVEFAFVFPGGIVAILLIDRVGRKPLQTMGFLGMFASLMLFSLTRSSIPVIGAFTLYGLTQFFSQAGPGSISASGMLGVELAPTKVRGLVQAMTVAAGRTGAVITAFLFPYLPLNVAIGILSVVALAAAVLTYFGIPETKGRPLEESSGEIKVVEIEEKSKE